MIRQHVHNESTSYLSPVSFDRSEPFLSSSDTFARPFWQEETQALSIFIKTCVWEMVALLLRLAAPPGGRVQECQCLKLMAR